MENHRWKKLLHSPILSLVKGSLLAQIIIICTSPITTRLYTPEEFGVYSLLLTVVTIAGPIICGKFETALVTENEKESIYATFTLSIIFNIFISIGTIFLYIIYLLFRSETINFLHLLVLFLILLLTGLSNILISFNTRFQNYKLISSVYLLRTGFQNSTLILFGLLKLGIMGMIVSQLIGVIVGVEKLSRKVNVKRVLQVNSGMLKKVFIKNKDLLLYTVPAQLINSTSYSILNFFISALYGNVIFGFYSLSFRILGIPLTIVSQNVSKVFFQKAVDEKRDFGTFNNSLKSTTLLLICLAVPMTLFFIFFGQVIFEVVFGKGWAISGEFVQYLAVMFGIRLIVSSLTPAFLIAKKQRLELWFQSVFLMTSVIVYFICSANDLSITLFLILINIFYSMVYVIIYIVIYNISKKKN